MPTSRCPVSIRQQLAQFFARNKNGILGMFNMFSGGALSRFTVFAIGIMPYISTSIVVQLLSIVVPSLEALKKEGEAGRRKITQYTRYFTVGLAIGYGGRYCRRRWSIRPAGDQPRHRVPLYHRP